MEALADLDRLSVAEKDDPIRTLVRKVSGCLRTLRGAQSFCTIRSYLDTLRKQGVHPFHALIQTFQGNVPQPRVA